jgi:hypothetical protein
VLRNRRHRQTYLKDDGRCNLRRPGGPSREISSSMPAYE